MGLLSALTPPWRLFSNCRIPKFPSFSTGSPIGPVEFVVFVPIDGECERPQSFGILRSVCRALCETLK